MSRWTIVARPSRRPPAPRPQHPTPVRTGFVQAALRGAIGRRANDNPMPASRRLRAAVGILAVLGMLAGLVYLIAVPA